MSTMGYYNFVASSSADAAFAYCSQMYPSEMELLRGYNLNLQGYDIALGLKEGRMTWDEAIEFIWNMLKATNVIRAKLTENEYFNLYYLQSDLVPEIIWRIDIADCPDGGKAATNTINVTQCYYDTFSDSTGSGVYSPKCYYKK